MLAATLLFFGAMFWVSAQETALTAKGSPGSSAIENSHFKRWQSPIRNQKLKILVRKREPNRQEGGRPLTQGELKALVKAGYKIYPLSRYLAEKEENPTTLNKYQKLVWQLGCCERK